jgi:hypothetical protein
MCASALSRCVIKSYTYLEYPQSSGSKRGPLQVTGSPYHFQNRPEAAPRVPKVAKPEHPQNLFRYEGTVFSEVTWIIEKHKEKNADCPVKKSS